MAIKKFPALNNAGLQVRTKLTGHLSAELFSCLFYVAASRLNSPRLSLPLIRRGALWCQARLKLLDMTAQFWLNCARSLTKLSRTYLQSVGSTPEIRAANLMLR